MSIILGDNLKDKFENWLYKTHYSFRMDFKRFQVETVFIPKILLSAYLIEYAEWCGGELIVSLKE